MHGVGVRRPRSTEAHNIKEGKVEMSSAQDENAATQVRVEPGSPRARGPGRPPASNAFRIRLFED